MAGGAGAILAASRERRPQILGFSARVRTLEPARRWRNRAWANRVVVMWPRDQAVELPGARVARGTLDSDPVGGS